MIELLNVGWAAGSWRKSGLESGKLSALNYAAVLNLYILHPQPATLCDPSVSAGMKRLLSTAPSVAPKQRRSWRKDSRSGSRDVYSFLVPFPHLEAPNCSLFVWRLKCSIKKLNREIVSWIYEFYSCCVAKEASLSAASRCVSTSWERTTSPIPETSASVSRSTSIWASSTTPASASTDWTSTWWVAKWCLNVADWMFVRNEKHLCVCKLWIFVHTYKL